MAIDQTIYTSAYLRRRELWQHVFAAFAEAFAHTFGRGSIVDVGCAGGLLVEQLRERGYEAWGIDGAPASESLWPHQWRSHYVLADLTRCHEIDLPPTEFVCSLEVAEHLPQSCAAAYVALLTRHRPSRVLFTAAPVGQSGLGHVNCQPLSYWIGLFAASRYELDVTGFCRVRQHVRAAFGKGRFVVVPSWYVNNFVAFRPVAEPGLSAEAPDVMDAVRCEAEAQRQVLQLLVQKTANVAELLAIMRRHLGEPTEPSEDDDARLRQYAW